MSENEGQLKADLDSTMESSTAIEEYKVGYGKPPKVTRFCTGQSGNPKGRPKGRKNLETVLNEELEAMIMINEGGKRKPVTKMAAIVKQGVNQAITSNGKAVPWVVAMKVALVDREKEAASACVGAQDKTGRTTAALPKNTYDELNEITDRLRARYGARLRLNEPGAKGD